MSYIRSISNPEGLYIVGTGENVEIHLGRKSAEPYKTLYIPTKVFKGLIKKFAREDPDDYCKYEGALIEFVKIGNDFKWRLVYDDWEVYMWEVTWEYIVTKKTKLLPATG